MRRPLDRFEAVFHRVLLFLASLVAIMIGLYAVLIPLNLFLIKTGLGNLSWLYEAVEYTLYAGVFLAAPWVLQQGAHVKVDVVTQALPKKTAATLERAMDGFGALLCAGLSIYGGRSALSEFIDGTLPDKDLRIETWIMMAVFSFSFLLLTIEFLLRLRRAKEIVAKEETAASEAGF